MLFLKWKLLVLIKDTDQKLYLKGVNMVSSCSRIPSQSSTFQDYWAPLTRNGLSLVGIKIVFLLKKRFSSCNFNHFMVLTDG